MVEFYIDYRYLMSKQALFLKTNQVCTNLLQYSNPNRRHSEYMNEINISISASIISFFFLSSFHFFFLNHLFSIPLLRWGIDKTHRLGGSHFLVSRPFSLTNLKIFDALKFNLIITIFFFIIISNTS